jgi:GNAT superfamily N-acetyltransferase
MGKIILNEDQVKRLVKILKEDQEFNEIRRYDFNDPAKAKAAKKRMDYKRVVEDPTNHKLIVSKDDLQYFFTHNDEESQLVIIVLDKKTKMGVGHAGFFMIDASTFEATVPFVDPEYRNRGIATEIYRIALLFGDVVSGEAQSQFASGLWKRLYRELPNKMVAVDRSTGEEYDVTTTQNGELKIDTDEPLDIYDAGKNIILKLEHK